MLSSQDPAIREEQHRSVGGADSGVTGSGPGCAALTPLQARTVLTLTGAREGNAGAPSLPEAGPRPAMSAQQSPAPRGLPRGHLHEPCR